MMTPADTGLRGAVDRAFALLTAILDDDGRHGIGFIASDVGLPVSTAHRLVAAMVRHKLLTRTVRGHYVAAHHLAVRGGTDSAHRALSIAARPVLSRLAKESQATAHLGVLQDMVTYLVKESDPAANLFTQEGMQLEAYCSAVGKMLLAHLSDEDLTKYLKGGALVPLTAQTITDEAQLREHLAMVRCNAYAIDHREISEDLICIAVPIHSADGNVIAAISCSRTGAEPLFDDMIALLTKAATAIESSL
jgi:IclR family acetate operon transcriptional repressor